VHLHRHVAAVALDVGADLRGADGRVDPAHSPSRLRRRVRRAAQQQITTALHRWADDGAQG